MLLLVEVTAYEAYKICHAVGLLKKANSMVCVFYAKRRLKIEHCLEGSLVYMNILGLTKISFGVN